MAKMLSLPITQMVFFSLNIFAFFIHTSCASGVYDLNVPLDRNEIIEDNTNNDTIVSSDNEVSSSNKQRVEWHPFIPAEISDQKEKIIRSLEAYRQANCKTNFWNVSSIHPKAALLLCTRAWASLKPKDLTYIKKGDHICDGASRRQTGSVGFQYICHHRYISRRESYIPDLIRCNCKYVTNGNERATKGSKQFFFLHHVTQQQYLIYSTVDPDSKTAKERSHLHVVDFFIDS